VRSLSWETVLHKLLQRGSFPWAAALHKLPQRGSFPRGAVLQAQAAPAWVPHRVTSPASRPALAWAPLSTGPQALAGACSSVGSTWGHSLLQASTCSSMGSLPKATGGDLLHHGPSWAAGEQPASPWSSSCAAREDSLLQHLEHLLHPHSSLTLVSAELFLSPVFTLLSCCSCHCTVMGLFFPPFLNTLSRGTTIIADGLGLGQWRVHLGASWHWLCQTWGKLLAAAHSSHPCSPPATKTSLSKPNTVE